MALILKYWMLAYYTKALHPISFRLSLQIKVWFSVEGEKHLTALDSLPLSLAAVKDMRQSLEQFFEESVVSLNIVHFFLTCCFLL